MGALYGLMYAGLRGVNGLDPVVFIHIMNIYIIPIMTHMGRVRGLAVACWTTDHYHPCSNLGVGISEGCFVFDFVSLLLQVARPI